MSCYIWLKLWPPVPREIFPRWATDTVHPAILGDLQFFSQTYEDARDTSRIQQLWAALDSWRGARPPLMPRRMKRDKLPSERPQEDTQELFRSTVE